MKHSITGKHHKSCGRDTCHTIAVKTYLHTPHLQLHKNTPFLEFLSCMCTVCVCLMSRADPGLKEPTHLHGVVHVTVYSEVTIMDYKMSMVIHNHVSKTVSHTATLKCATALYVLVTIKEMGTTQREYELCSRYLLHYTEKNGCLVKTFILKV